MNIPDNYDQFVSHEQKQKQWLDSQPICEYCHHHIQEEKLMDIYGSLYHTECAIKEFQKDTDDYVA